MRGALGVRRWERQVFCSCLLHEAELGLRGLRAAHVKPGSAEPQLRFLAHPSEHHAGIPPA